ncbi:hypothetical protein CVU82_02015 [Candidatus Falkowbacteria bacterium HGW-Falkowbacteria-1]|uniref:SIMPL domain-containing protein n=1 Tax=Candidatus Falkowbacteria bacterium HGW-Falkowbacteria-1 TaxID=2013768 RepID=A0A2N2E9G1_9BACT|nr:MAG: hypothetical protein CVU82_02015 [Candidatus Falkowbacteria bacterium HGW-Falkowbacteria-1]
MEEKKNSKDCSCHQNKSFKLVIALVLILALSGVAVISILRDRIVNPIQNQVSVNGQGRVSYEPNIANITIGVQVDKVEQPEEALGTLNGKVNKIIASLNVLGVDSKDIKNQNYSLYPFYDYVEGVNKMTGYNANQQIVVKVYDVDKSFNKVNQIISEATKAGANQIIGVNFESSEIEKIKQDARLLAIKDAKNKAQSLSESVGVSLGDIVGWWENVTNPYPYYDYSYGGMGGGGNPSVNSGSYEVLVDVSINYKIEKSK